MLAAEDIYSLAAAAGAEPDPLLTVSEWADRYRQLSQRSSSEPGPWRTDRTPYLREIMDCLSPSSRTDTVVLMKGAQVGGPLALDTLLPTFDGWTTMGRVYVGERLFDERGKPCEVKSVSPIFIGRQCYRICLSDDSEFVCDGEHRWVVWQQATSGPVRKKLTTEQMFKNSGKGFSIEVAQPLSLPRTLLPYDPYDFGLAIESCGVLGGIRQEELIERLEDGITLQCYLRSSIAQRQAFLQGLLEGGEARRVEDRELANVCSKAFFETAFELLVSLGDPVSNPWEGNTRSRRLEVPGAEQEAEEDSWERLSNGTLVRKIVSIAPVASVPVRCIEVNSPSHLYLAGWAMVPTHNTECGNNWIGYVIQQAPGPMLAVQPTVEMAKRNSKQRIDPLIEESPRLSELVSDPRSRDSGNTMLSKEFPGGILVMTGANSAIGLRSMAARYLFCDEVDGYPGDVDGEGDPVNLALARTRTFARRKVFMVSTPKIAGRSRIEALFEESDQRWFWVPCPACNGYQILEFPQLRWPKDRPREAKYCCKFCEASIDNHKKQWMLARGEWRPAAPGPDKAVGFHLSSLYSPVGWFSWADVAQSFMAAKDDPALLQVFTNTVLGQVWKERGDAPEWERLYNQREDYQIGFVPAGGVFLTAGIDIQKDRIEAEVVAWGRGKESWSIDYKVLEGQTAQAIVWEKLTEFLKTTFPAAGGARLPISKFAIDSGYATPEVYDWIRQHGKYEGIAIKGDSRAPGPVGQASPVEVGPRGQRIQFGIKVWPVNTGMIKEELYRWLHLIPEDDGTEVRLVQEGCCHFPKYSEEYFKQLTAEQLVTRMVKGYKRPEWQKTRDRNEALDCRVYARAAAAVFGLDRFNEDHWAALESKLTPSPAPNTVPVKQPGYHPRGWIDREATKNWMKRGRDW